MNPVIETEQLTKKFGRKEALKNLTLHVPEGSIFAFLGPNGAGKTTAIKTLMNIVPPSEGRATVLNVDSTRLGPAQFAQIGYVSENQKLPEWMTVQQLLDFCRPFYPTWDDSFVDKLQEHFHLPLDQKIKNMSRGMKVKAALLSSLAYRPRLLVLDEPFSGLDPLVRDEFIRAVLELTEQEHWTVFISSHDIDEVERLADCVGIINQGELKIMESMESLQARFRQIEVVFTDPQPPPIQIPDSWLLWQQSGATGRLIESAFDEQTELRIRAQLPSATQIDIEPMSLREIFLTLVKVYKLSNQ